MDKLYCKSICEYLLAQKQENGYDFNVALNEGNLMQKFSKGDWSLFPCAIISGNYEYRTDDFQNRKLDFSRELPAMLCPTLTILADNVSDVVETEKAVTPLFCNKVTLQTEQIYQTGERILFDIAIDDLSKIERSNKDFTYQDGKRTLYETTIYLKTSADVVIFLRNFHPAEIDFDKNVQLQLVKRGKALEELKLQMDKFTAEQAQQITSGYEEIFSMLGLSVFDGFGFAELYQVMSDNKCDVKTAMVECSKVVAEQAQRAEEEAKKAAEEQRKEAERQQAEANRVKHINEIFSKQGDTVINRYTDGIIADINSRLDLPYSVSVYGGSTFSEWHRRNELNELDYPNILVQDIVNFSFDHKTYRTVGANGDFIDRPFSTEILPINYGIKIEIHANSKTQLAEIKQRIKDWYTEPQETPVTLPLYKGENFHVGIYYKSDLEEIYNKSFDFGCRNASDGTLFSSQYVPKKKPGVFREVLSFYEYQSVYFVQPCDKKDLENNRKLQISLLRMAVFYGECSNKLTEAVKSLNGNYKELVSGKSSFLNFLNSQEFKILKNCYDNRMPLDENLFNSVFSRIVDVYPNLYQKTVQRLPYEQVQADIQKYADMFNDKFVELFTMLGVPTQFKHFSGEVPYLFTNLRAYAGRMEENAELSLNEALDLQEKERIEADRFNREQQAEREYQQSNSSGGHGILSGLVNSAINNTQNRGFGFSSSNSNSGKQSLWGTAMCPYGKKNASGFSIRCNIGCPMWSECGGK